MKMKNAFLLATWCVFLTVNFSFAQTWTQSDAPQDVWISIASSADGKKLVAATLSTIYTSTNSGINWVKEFGPSYGVAWASVASSIDGSKLAAATASHGIYVSTNSGLTWEKTSAPDVAWNSIASSSDGAKLAATMYEGGLYTSTNSGMTWMQQTNAPNANLVSIASSADGNKLLACPNYGTIYRSTNAGTTWISDGQPTGGWNSVASSANGCVLVAVGYGNGIYVSINSGASWRTNFNFYMITGGYGPQWCSVSCSADGQRIIAACPYFFSYAIYSNFSTMLSTDFGHSWTVINTDNHYWKTVAASADGSKLFEAGNTTGIYTLQTTLPPYLNLKMANSILDISWLVPSTNFVLQQSLNLVTWTDVTNIPILNFTNLQNNVWLPISDNNHFYRLETP